MAHSAHFQAFHALSKSGLWISIAAHVSVLPVPPPVDLFSLYPVTMRATEPKFLGYLVLCVPHLLSRALCTRAHPMSVLGSDPALSRLLDNIFGGKDLLLPGLQATPIPSDSATLRDQPFSNAVGQPQTSTTLRPVVGVADQSDPQWSGATGIWNSPVQYDDLASFGVRKLAYGADNIAFVTGSLPITAPVRHLVEDLLDLGSNLLDGGFRNSISPESDGSWPAPNTSTTLMQVKFPAGSINPGANRDLRGGAGFYALPVQLAGTLPTAMSVSFAYSVYFPPDFDWVKGGKLPGLWGGDPTCSGGNSAMKCFSTRLMWRAGGEGELYLVRGIVLCSTSDSLAHFM